MSPRGAGFTDPRRYARRCTVHRLELDETAIIVTRAGAVLGGALVCPARARHIVRRWEVFDGERAIAICSHTSITILVPEAFAEVYALGLFGLSRRELEAYRALDGALRGGSRES